MLKFIPHSFTIVIVAMMVFLSCNSSTKRKEIHVLGKVQQAETVLLLEQQTVELLPVDSARVKDEEAFYFILHSHETGIYALRFNPGKQVVFIASPGDTITITGELDHFPGSIQVMGNEESILLQTFYSYSNENHRKIDALQSIVEQHQNDPDFYQLTLHLDSAFTEIWEEQRTYEKAFIRDHPGTLTALMVVNYHFGVRPVLSPDIDLADYILVDSGLIATYPDNKHTQFFHRWLEEVK
ncbi:MAG: DUF4369 domain-containing protein [Bacteroidia bacterium]|nr:DUF4369 domain-containing protein [Bacteroidia bacterium]